jgi:predicted RNA binding protein YcfA (HicA-like mRNA interferase family)
MRHPDGRTVPIPVHPGRDMPKGTLRNILAIIGMEADEMRELLRG